MNGLRVGDKFSRIFSNATKEISATVSNIPKLRLNSLLDKRSVPAKNTANSGAQSLGAS